MSLVCLAFVIVAAVTGIGLAGGLRGATAEFDRLMREGVPARGILLRVTNRPGGITGVMPRRFQLRSVVIDIEIPGRPPYETAGWAWIPMNCVRDVLPGATVELRVDRTNGQKFIIVGPDVGFAPMIGAAPVTSTQPQQGYVR